MSGPLLITFGSARQAESLVNAYQGHAEHLHIDDRSLLKDKEQAAKIVTAACQGATATQWVNLGRASVPGAVHAIAEVWQTAASRIQSHTEIRRFGPSASAAATFDDKWLTYAASQAAGVPTVPSISTTPRELMMSGRGPTVAKLKDRTGGVGVYAAHSASSAARAISRIAGMDGPIIACDFVHGLEASIKVLVGGSVRPVALVVKEATRIPVVHGDWKTKVAIPLRQDSPLFTIAEQIVRQTGTQGFLSIEGIVTPAGKFLVSEIASRRTGSFAIADAVSACGPASTAIREILGEAKRSGIWMPGIAVTFAVGQPRNLSPAEMENSIGVDIEHLSELPDSEDDRSRMRMHFAPIEGEAEFVFWENLTPIVGVGEIAKAQRLVRSAHFIHKGMPYEL